MRILDLQLVYRNGSTPTVSPRIQATSLVKGEDFQYRLTCVNEDASIRNIAGHTFTLGIQDPSTGVRIINRLGSIVSAALGTAIVNGLSGDTATAAPGSYVLSVYSTDGANDWQPLPPSPLYLLFSASIPATPATLAGPTITPAFPYESVVSDGIIVANQYVAPSTTTDGRVIQFDINSMAAALADGVALDPAAAAGVTIRLIRMRGVPVQLRLDGVGGAATGTVLYHSELVPGAVSSGFGLAAEVASVARGTGLVSGLLNARV